MNALTKITLAVLSVFVTLNTANAKAMTNEPTAPASRVHTAANHIREADLLPAEASKPAQSCIVNDNLPQLSFYLDDGTPTDIAYSDYLEDLDHWKFWTARNCDVAPEKLH